jgi:hypothetical protein
VAHTRFVQKGDVDDCAVAVSVSRHAVHRYADRGGSHVSPAAMEREIKKCILDAIDSGMLLNVGRNTHLAPLKAKDVVKSFAVLKVAGPVEKPFAITVCTVITAEMAINSFTFATGLMHMLARPEVLPILRRELR